MSLLTTAVKIGKSMQRFTVKNASHILMATGTGCTLSALISAFRLTPAAKEAEYEAKYDKTYGKAESEVGHEGVDIDFEICEGNIPLEKLTFWEWIRAVWKYYGPAVALEILALVCFWGAHGIDIHRQTVLLGLVATGEETIREYQKKIQELLGKDAEKEIRNAIAQDKVDRNPPPSTYIVDGSAEQPFLFVFHDQSIQHINTSWHKIKEAENKANHEMIQNMYISEAELVWLLDPERKYLKPVPGSGDVGWDVDNLMVLDIDWAEGPNHLPVGTIRITDTDGLVYPPRPGFSKM